MSRGHLDYLGHRYGTDKASGHHNYLWWYETFLYPLRDKELILLEIGVGEGASLRMWRDYFQRARVIGMDIDRDKLRFVEPQGRIEIVIGDQASEEDLSRVQGQFGPFDIIVDDACHGVNEQINTYNYLMPKLPNRGIYILEDLGGDPVYQHLCGIAGQVMRGSDQICSVAFYKDTSITQRVL